MSNLINLVGNIAGILGVATCAVAGLVRLSGHYELAGYGAGTLLLVGTALMVLACLTKLHLLGQRADS